MLEQKTLNICKALKIYEEINETLTIGCYKWKFDVCMCREREWLDRCMDMVSSDI